MKLTRHKLLATFGERTFQRGREYYQEGMVVERIRFQDHLWGKVSGSRSEPYKVSISVNMEGDVETKCSCPMRSGCKHAVALALCWIEEPDSFTDAAKIMGSLEKKSKEEIVELIGRILRSKPDLISDLEVEVSSLGGEVGINLEAFGKKIARAVYGNLDYYHIPEAVGELEEVREVADSLAKRSKFKEAAELYFRLVEGCVDAFENGADDSDGEMGELAVECISSFNECMREVRDEGFKDSLLPRVFRLYDREDYGIEIQEMFAGVVTRENIGRIEEALQQRLKEYLRKHERDDFSSRYKKREVKETLVELYRRIGNPSKALELAQSEMEDVGDYAFAAHVLVQEGEYQEALEVIRKGSKLKNMGREHQLHEVYLQLMEALIREGRGEEIDVNEALGHAVSLIASNRALDVEDHRKMRAMFSKLDAEERLTTTVKERLRGDPTLVDFLLLEGDVHGAAEALGDVKDGRDTRAISIARAAREKGETDLSRRMTSVALKSGLDFYYSGDKLTKSLIRELLTTAPQEELEDIIRNLKVGREVSMFIAEELSSKAPRLALEVLENNIETCSSEKLVTIARKLARKGPSEAVKLCKLWITKFVPRSHVYYNDAVEMLRIMKESILASGNDEGWRKYLLAFKMKYRTRKKLMERLETAGV